MFNPADRCFMFKQIVLAAALCGVGNVASADDVLMTAYVQQVILQPRGSAQCPELCPEAAPGNPDAPKRVCVGNDGGCQIIDVKVQQVYRGQAAGPMRRFASRIGEWGPNYPLSSRLIAISEDRGNVYWSPITERDGRILIDPQRLRFIGGVQIAQAGDGPLLALDEALARSAKGGAK
jgi:hypothetical protein